MKHKYMTEQDDNNNEEGTTESANKNLPKHDLSNCIRQNIREPQNIQKITGEEEERKIMLTDGTKAMQRREEEKRKHIRETKRERNESIKT